MEYISEIVRLFLDFKNDNNSNYDPLSPLMFTITVEQAKEIDNYYKKTIQMRNEEIRQLKEVIVNQEKSKLTTK